jgi:hypothetical protein
MGGGAAGRGGGKGGEGAAPTDDNYSYFTLLTFREQCRQRKGELFVVPRVCHVLGVFSPGFVCPGFACLRFVSVFHVYNEPLKQRKKTFLKIDH